MIHDLGRRLISDLSARTPNQNVFVSPVSIGMALAMLAAGAAGDTRASILKALGVSNPDQDQLDQYFVGLEKLLTRLDPERAELIEWGAIPDGEPAARADIANGLWLNKDLSFVQAFVDQARATYQAEVQGADFGADETVDIINRWVSKCTQGNIDRIVDELSQETSLVLINAVYFKGSWSMPFDLEDTAEAPFTLPDGSQIPCDLMFQRDDLYYFESKIFQLVMIPIARARLERRDGAYLMVMLPRPGKSCDDVIGVLGSDWQSLKRHIRTDKVRLWLPRFRIAYGTSLNDTLKAFGMEPAFSRQADFSGISPTLTRVSDVQHKTTLLVNERGAEASAITSLGMLSFGLTAPEPIEMRVDRPFICGIVLNPDLTPLFLGVINQPERV